MCGCHCINWRINSIFTGFCTLGLPCILLMKRRVVVNLKKFSILKKFNYPLKKRKLWRSKEDVSISNFSSSRSNFWRKSRLVFFDNTETGITTVYLVNFTRHTKTVVNPMAYLLYWAELSCRMMEAAEKVSWDLANFWFRNRTKISQRHFAHLLHLELRGL
jgi:hypothetical protein